MWSFVSSFFHLALRFQDWSILQLLLVLCFFLWPNNNPLYCTVFCLFLCIGWASGLFPLFHYVLVAENIHAQVFVRIHIFISLGCVLRNGTAMLSCFSHIQLFKTLWTIAHWASLSMGFLRQEYWSGLPFLSPGDLPEPGIEPVSLKSPALGGGFFIISINSVFNLIRNCQPASQSSCTIFQPTSSVGESWFLYILTSTC